MKCANCNASNNDSAKFCSKCGYPLNSGDNINISNNEDFFNEVNQSSNNDNSFSSLNNENSQNRNNNFNENINGNYNDNYSNDYYEPEKKPGGAKKGIIIGILVLIIAVGGFFGYKYFINQQADRLAQSYMESGDFDKAKEEYQKLINKTKDPKYSKKYKEASALSDDLEKLKRVDSMITGELYYEAMSILSSIKEDNSLIKEKVQSKMDEIIPLVNKEIQQKIDNRYFDEAITDVNGYLLLAPESDSLKNLKKKAEEAAKKDKKDNDDANSSVSSAKQAQSQAKYDSSEDARMNILASKLIDTTQVITSSEANVRSGPSLNASVVGTVTRGDSVYVYSVQPAPGRVWCNVGNGEWISSKTMGYN